MSIFTHIWTLLFVHYPRPTNTPNQSGYWAGVDSAWEQKKLEGWKMSAAGRADFQKSVTRFVRRGLKG